MKLTRRSLLTSAIAGSSFVSWQKVFGQTQKNQVRARQKSQNNDGANTGPYDFTNSYDSLAAYAKMRGRLDGGIGIFHYLTHCYGLPDGKSSRLMFRQEGVSLQRVTVREDQNLEIQHIEVSYIQHADTGAVMDWYDNPYTGMLVKVSHTKPTPSPRMVMTPVGGYNPDVDWELPSLIQSKIGAPLFTSDGRIFFSDDTILFMGENVEKNARVIDHIGDLSITQLITLESSARQVQDPELTSAKSVAIISSVMPWGGWLKMTTVPGHMILRCLAEKLDDQAEVPHWLARRIDNDFPNFFTEPLI